MNARKAEWAEGRDEREARVAREIRRNDWLEAVETLAGGALLAALAALLLVLYLGSTPPQAGAEADWTAAALRAAGADER